MLADLPGDFDAALANIPLEGDITHYEYQQFVAAYSKVFTDNNEKPTLAPATRLLAMRRPDLIYSDYK